MSNIEVVVDNIIADIQTIQDAMIEASRELREL